MRTSRACAVSGAVQRLIPQASAAQRKRPDAEKNRYFGASWA